MINITKIYISVQPCIRKNNTHSLEQFHKKKKKKTQKAKQLSSGVASDRPIQRVFVFTVRLSSVMVPYNWLCVLVENAQDSRHTHLHTHTVRGRFTPVPRNGWVSAIFTDEYFKLLDVPDGTVSIILKQTKWKQHHECYSCCQLINVGNNFIKLLARGFFVWFLRFPPELDQFFTLDLFHPREIFHTVAQANTARENTAGCRKHNKPCMAQLGLKTCRFDKTKAWTWS